MLFFMSGLVVGILIGVNIYYIYKQDRFYRSVRDEDTNYLFILKDNKSGILDGYRYDEIKKEIVFEIQDESTGEIIRTHLENIAYIISIDQNKKKKEEK